VVTTAAAKSTYHVAYRRPLSSGLLLLYRIRKCSHGPSRRTSRLSNCLSRSDSSLFNALPSLETLESPQAASYTPTFTLAARQEPSMRSSGSVSLGVRRGGSTLGGPGLYRWAGLRLGEVLVLLDRGWASCLFLTIDLASLEIEQ